MNMPDAQGRDAFMRLIDGAVARIVATEDYDSVLNWMHAPGRISEIAPSENIEEADHALAAMLTRSVWNATPLPGNRFRPLPLPKPQRNDPCPCGSGAKYKRCCAGFPAPEFDPDEIWPMALAHFGDAQIEQAMADHAIPAPALAEMAGKALDGDEPERARALLEPLFEGDPRTLDGRYEASLDLLCDVYNALGDVGAKQRLLTTLTEEGGKAIRVAAWQRLATVRNDQGDADGAWQAFQTAQRGDPEHPGLAPLEIMLLIGQGRSDEVPARAQFWQGKLAHNPHATPELTEFVEQARTDPEAAMLGVEPGDRLVRLAACLDAAAERPLPAYCVSDEPFADDEADVAADLHPRTGNSGPEPDEATPSVAGVQSDLFADLDPGDSPEQPPGEQAGDDESRFLQPPPALAGVRRRWREVCPVGKPFATAPQPPDAGQPWSPAADEDWLALVENEPPTLDDLDILDDLAAMLDSHEIAGTAAWVTRCYTPLLERAVAVIDAALAADSGTQLDWVHAHNRPALRLLFRYAVELRTAGDDGGATRRLRQYLALNPTDNHGARNLVIEHLLHAGDDRAALALCDQYRDDAFAEIAFGRVLAEYRLGDIDSARESLRFAHGINPHVITMLTRDDVPQPELNEYSMTLGGKDQAWFYREEMRAVWTSVDGLLDWAQQQVEVVE